MATKSLSDAGVLTLTNGDKTKWFDMQSIASAEFQLVVTGVVVIALRGANETTPTDATQAAAKTDQATLESFTSSGGRTIFEPMPRFIQFEQTSGAGSAVFSWGKAIGHDGGLATIGAQKYATSISSDLQ